MSKARNVLRKKVATLKVACGPTLMADGRTELVHVVRRDATRCDCGKIDSEGQVIRDGTYESGEE